MVLHRYWRIYITESTSGSNVLVSLYEVELRATPGGLDQCNGGVVTASHASADAYKLFDNNSSSYWVNGGPSAPTWFGYDFGTGVAVTVGEVRLLPRYASQAPKTFELHYSDNGTNWSVAASWSNITNWIGGVEQLFVPPPPPAVVVSVQKNQPFGLDVAATRFQPYLLGPSLYAIDTATYALNLEAASQHSWSLLVSSVRTHLFSRWLEHECPQPFSVLLDAACSHNWKRFVQLAVQQPFHAQVDNSRDKPWSLRHLVWAANQQPSITTWRVATSSGQWYTLQPRNWVIQTRWSYWNLAAPLSIRYSAVPAVRIDGWPLPFIAATIANQPGGACWSAQLRLALEADFGRMAMDDRFTLQVGTETFTLLVDGKRLERAGPNQVERILYGISPTARHDFPRAAAVTARWKTPVWARDVVETVLGETVIWELPEWRIRADRLAVQELSPLQVVQQIATAAGGVVQTRATGEIIIRPRFPYAVPHWATTTPHHILTDTADIVQIREERHTRTRVDRVIVRDGALEEQQAHLGIHLDQRENGPNWGQTHFNPGDTAYLAVTSGRAMTPTVTASVGQVLAPIPTTWQQTEELAFVASDRVRLTTPATTITTVLWLGVDLGQPVLQTDGITLLTPVAGTAIARVTYTVVASNYPFIAPHNVVGTDHFAVLLTATGQPAAQDILEVTAQRGNAVYPVREVVAPLVSDYRALRCRAQAELDQGEALQEVELMSVYRPGLESGQLVEIQDGFYGRSFRALLVGVQHQLDAQGWISRLSLLRG